MSALASMRPTLLGERYMISAGHPLVAQAAADALERGGTAIDAGVAAGLASNVVQPDQCNLGGVAPILIRQAGSNTVWSLSGVGPWSRNVDIESYLRRYPEGRPLGAPCSVVPAAAASWIGALARFGSWSFGAAAARAIELAEGGFPLDARTAQSLSEMGAGFGDWPTTRAIYQSHGAPLREGERLVQRDLAKTLRTLAEAEGARPRIQGLAEARRAFYEGDIARQIVDWVNAEGGWMTSEDLANFHCEVIEAPFIDYRGWRVHTGGLSGQGPMLLQTLAMLSGFDLPALGHNSADYVHLVVEALRLAFADREAHYGDPAFVPTKLADLIGPDPIAALRTALRRQVARPDEQAALLETPLPTRRDTTGFAIVDAEGNAFSCSPSDTLDGCPIVPGLGIIVSPRGLQSRLDRWHPASLQPGKRPRMTASPALALSLAQPDQARVMAFNAPGGDVIVQGELQGFLNIVEFGMSVQQAIEAPRFATLSFPDSFHPHAHEPGRLSLEGRFDEATRAELARRGHKVHVWPDFAFDATALAIVMDMRPPNGTRTLAGGADPRRANYAWGR